MNSNDENQSNDMEGDTTPPHVEWNPTTQEYVPLGPPQENTEVDELSDSLSSKMNMQAASEEKMFDDTADDEPVAPPVMPPAVEVDYGSVAAAMPSVPSHQPRFKNSKKRRRQNREAQRRHRQKRRAELRASRPTIPLPALPVLSTPIAHAASVDVSAVRAQQREIENMLGLGRLSKKMLLRREAQRTTRDRILENLRAKIEVEEGRKAEMDTTQAGEKAWLKLESRVSASKPVRKDQRDGGLLSESENDSDIDGGLVQALPSVPTKKSLEARLVNL
jgi:hypothetical protein